MTGGPQCFQCASLMVTKILSSLARRTIDVFVAAITTYIDLISEKVLTPLMS